MCRIPSSVISRDDRLQLIARFALLGRTQRPERIIFGTPTYMGSVTLRREKNYPAPAESLQFA